MLGCNLAYKRRCEIGQRSHFNLAIVNVEFQTTLKQIRVIDLCLALALPFPSLKKVRVQDGHDPISFHLSITSPSSLKTSQLFVLLSLSSSNPLLTQFTRLHATVLTSVSRIKDSRYLPSQTIISIIVRPAARRHNLNSIIRIAKSSHQVNLATTTPAVFHSIFQSPCANAGSS